MSLKFMPKKLTLIDFIKKSEEKHGKKYDYSKSEYINSKTKVIIICEHHGQFLQTPVDHYLSECGCPKCDPTSNLGSEEFIKRSKEIHKYKYDYSKVNYGKNNYDKVIIICKKHGEFFQTPWAHMRKQGCPLCSNNQKYTTKDFIEKANLKHKELYDYSLVNYKSKNIKIKIICNKHGFFEQKPSVHLQGHGCPTCNNSKLESYFRKYLIDMKISFNQNKRFLDCRNKLPLPFDFYLVEKNILVELDGIQHRKSIDYFGGYERLKYQKLNDSIKSKWCEENNIKLIRLKTFKEIDFFFKEILNLFN